MKKIIYLLLSFFLLLSFPFSLSAEEKRKVKYRTAFGGCPTKELGSMTLRLVELFNQNQSLQLIKQEILLSDLVKKYFLQKYSVTYNPITHFLDFHFICPEPLAKLQIFDKQKLEKENPILVVGSNLYLSRYEKLLLEEEKIKGPLPYLSIYKDSYSSSLKSQMTELLGSLNQSIKKNLSEIIITDQKELTVILKTDEGPTTAFLGSDRWHEKWQKLTTIINYLQNKEHIPTTINLTNLEKIVVKFTD